MFFKSPGMSPHQINACALFGLYRLKIAVVEIGIGNGFGGGNRSTCALLRNWRYLKLVAHSRLSVLLLKSICFFINAGVQSPSPQLSGYYKRSPAYASHLAVISPWSLQARAFQQLVFHRATNRWPLDMMMNFKRLRKQSPARIF